MYAPSCNGMKSMKVETLQSHNRGYTLLNILLYLTLATTLASVVGGLSVDLLRVAKRSDISADIIYTHMLASTILEQAVREARAITGPTILATSSTLTLTMDDPVRDPTVFHTHDGVVYMTAGAGSPQQLSSSSTVTEMIFQNTTQSDGVGMTKIWMSISASTTSSLAALSVSEQFESTLRLRVLP